MKYIGLTVLVFCSLVAAVHAAGEAYPNAQLLLEANAIAKADKTDQYVILDVRPQPAYDEAHIPGARRIDHDQWKAAFHSGKQPSQWSRRIGQLGIGPDSQVVIYDDNKSKDAARIWWLLRYWGVDGASLLNGGWKSWQAGNFPTSAQQPQAAEATNFKATPLPTRLATKQSLLDQLDSKSLQVIDARSFGEFCGTVARQNERSGAIPGAKHLEWSDLIDPETDRFKSAPEINALLKQAKIDLDKPLVTHCQSGGRASVMAFGLELMGGEQVSNYYQGWSEWGNDPATPIEQPAKSEASEP